MTYSKEKLQEMAAVHFAKLGVDKLYATSDGQFFLLASRASLHAQKAHTVYALKAEKPKAQPPMEPEIKTEGPTTSGEVQNNEPAIEPVEPNQPAGPDEPAPPSIAVLTEMIKDETDLAKLNHMLLDEVAGLNRKGACAAIEKRIAFLTDLRKDQ